eukprot:TRINITY_DN29136_c0_g1_i1.p1 TRINITY_DN29136_c0_g1~~TRINITY_DN29136_c0_g1_i1.p1  ORF type:complete len:549 (+),score=80.80 TRINITY_DN29136_c0_g1_i1:61-1707(+)
MGRFSSWAQQKPSCLESGCETKLSSQASGYEAAGGISTEEAWYIVHNGELRSQSNGIRYRLSPNMRDTHSSMLALFGSQVKGTLCDGDWLKVGRRYLPTHIGEAEVLRRLTGLRQPAEAARPSYGTADAGNDQLLGQMIFGPSAESPTGAKAAIPRQILIRPETSAFGSEPLLRSGEGAIYEVQYDRIAIRSAPTTQSTTLEIKLKGSEVELFEWDSSRLWRRCPADASGTTAGWAMLDHPEFGPLLRPKDLLFCASPLDPICVAAFEGQLKELQRFLREGLHIHGSGGFDPSVCDAAGNGPLALAAQTERLGCIVLLVEAGAAMVPNMAQQALDAACSARARSLLEVLLGRYVSNDDALQDALASLGVDARLAADRIMQGIDESRNQAPARTVGGDGQRCPNCDNTLAFDEIFCRRCGTNCAKEVKLDVSAEDVEADMLPRQGRAGLAESVTTCASNAASHKKRKGGKIYEVVHKAVAIRYLPSTNADMVGTRIKGHFVELFESDASGKWRMFFDADTGDEGWILLQHAQLGDLVRPVDQKVLDSLE